MGLFSKRDSVPDLPAAPTLPDLPKMESKKGLPELPSFPKSSKNENLNREIVKSAVSDDSVSGEEEVTLEFPSLNVREEATQMLPPKVSEIQVDEPPRRIRKEIDSVDFQSSPSQNERSTQHTVEPIFVRIDKFQSSQESFDKILSKVREIEGTIAKLRKVKSQEEEELSKWSSEVEQLKSRLSDIDDNIFSQI